MRILSYTLIAVGILLLMLAGHDELRGLTHAPSMGTGSALYSDEMISRADQEDFHNAMRYHWFFASMILGAGIILVIINRGQDAVDPMATDLDKNIDEELREDEQSEESKK